MTFRLVAIDLDGTLLDRQLNLSPGAAMAAERARDHGAFVTLATGRMFSSALPYARQLGIDGHLITFQGALIKHTTSEEILYSRPMPTDLARQVIDVVAGMGLHINCHVEEEVLVEQVRPEAELYARHSGRPITRMKSLARRLDRSPHKLLVISLDPRALEQARQRLEVDFPELHLAYSMPTFLEVMPRGINKGRALEVLAHHLGIERREVMAVGDSFNDLEMLEYAGLGVVMDSAPDPVKARAGAVVARAEAGGIAEALLRFVCGVNLDQLKEAR